jgi:hypothetical protein
MKFDDNFLKIIADAKKLGVMDERAEMMVKDFLKTIASEINKKQDNLQALLGEISQLKKMK